MNAPPVEAGAPAVQPAPSRWRSLVAFLIGAGLLAAAAWVVGRQGDMLTGAWESIRSAPPGLVALAFFLPLVNFALVSVSFWLLMRREGRVTLPEMTCLVGTAWLLNFAPMRPGLVGRIAYHRAVNGIPVARSVRVTVVGLVAAGAAVLTTLAIAALLGSGAPWPAWAAALAAPAVLAAAAAGALRVRGPIGAKRPGGPTHQCAPRDQGAPKDMGVPEGPGVREHAGAPEEPGVLKRPVGPRRPDASLLAVTFLLRYLDTLVWAARYWVLFALVGSPIGLGGAVAVGAVAQAAMLVPLVGNGLGIREWAAGLTAAALPAGVLDATGSPAAVGLAADLVNRAIEIAVAVPVGVACSLWIAARVRRPLPGILPPTGTPAG